MEMSGSEIGMIGGTALGSISNIIGLRAQNKSVISDIQREGSLLASNMRQINTNRAQLDRELGDILSDNALATAKNMATAKVLMSTSGTVGGTTSQVSKQSYVEQIRADADVISKARNTDIGLLTDAVSKRMQYRLNADAIRSNITSPMSALIQGITSSISGASQGAMLGKDVESALPNKGISFPTIGTNNLGSIDVKDYYSQYGGSK